MKKNKKSGYVCKILAIIITMWTCNTYTIFYKDSNNSFTDIGMGTMTIWAADGLAKRIHATIDNEILSKDPFDTGDIFFYEDAIIDGDKLIVYYKGLGKISYKGKTYNPVKSSGTQYDNGEWDYYELPYTKGQNDYTYKIYSKITDYVFHINMHIDVTEDKNDNNNSDDNKNDNSDNNNNKDDSSSTEIPITVLQETLDNKSVLNDYAYQKAEITKNQNDYTLTIYIKHWYDKASGVQAVEYINYNGERLVKKENVKEIDGEMYDTHVINLQKLTDTLPVTVMVIPMEQMAAGFGTQKARIRLELSGYSGYDNSGDNTDNDNNGNNTNNNQNNSGNNEGSNENSQNNNTYNNAGTYINGDYMVNISAYKENVNEKSMASSYMKNQAKINVNNGIYTLTVYFKKSEMTFLEYNGIRASVYNEGEYDGFTFRLNDAGEYQLVTAGVAYMEKINLAMAVQRFRLKIDWSGVSGSNQNNSGSDVATGDSDVTTDITASVSGNLTATTGTLTPQGNLMANNTTDSELKNTLNNSQSGNLSNAIQGGNKGNSDEYNSEVNAAEYSNNITLREASKLGIVISMIIIILTVLITGGIAGITYYSKRRRLYRL
ncbi:NEAT domain-containing protein [Falcatimonas sp. MSJ-15]|uniref:NEAT domain-containing protein n=1 Tax=Falcatimonas sp. MSJ-15 TaxID=2841515 RepID=UPI001C11F080|nr:NEAT domain-containing protein [Falcatimonas sp. MSJ-15]